MERSKGKSPTQNPLSNTKEQMGQRISLSNSTDTIKIVNRFTINQNGQLSKLQNFLDPAAKKKCY